MPGVLIAHPSPDVYGSDRQLLESIAGLRAIGWEVTVCLPAEGPLVDLLSDVAIRLAPFSVLRKGLLSIAGLTRLAIGVPRDLVRLVRTVRRVRPDVVYVNTVTIPLWLVAAKLTRTPVVVHVHEAEERSARIVRTALYAPLLLASLVVANSETTRRILLEVQPRLASRLEVVLNGIPDPGPRALDEAEEGRVVLVSRLSPRKGIDAALEAVALLRRSGRDVSLDICGETFPGYEWFEHDLRLRSAAPDLLGSVRYLGYVSPTGPALAAGQVVIAPSLGESFGNAAVEALLAERPLVASDVQALAEILDNERTALLVPPADPVRLAAAIARLLDDPALARALARTGRAEALERFSTQRYRRELNACVARVAGPGAVNPEDERAP